MYIAVKSKDRAHVRYEVPHMTVQQEFCCKIMGSTNEGDGNGGTNVPF